MTASAEQRIRELGIAIPAPLQIPPGLDVPLVMLKVIGKRVVVSGHGPQEVDGSIAQPLGQVGAELTVEQGTEAARKTALAMIGTLQRELGNLDKIKSWVKVFGMVNSAPGFNLQTPVINGFSNQIIEIFGRESGMATRSAVGMAQLPFSIPVEVEAELELH
ncbi:MAG: RidA family protein [Gammaproteobacteria bacterium]